MLIDFNRFNDNEPFGSADRGRAGAGRPMRARPLPAGHRCSRTRRRRRRHRLQSGRVGPRHRRWMIPAFSGHAAAPSARAQVQILRLYIRRFARIHIHTYVYGFRNNVLHAYMGNYVVRRCEGFLRGV